jgi:hypothetical protein
VPTLEYAAYALSAADAGGVTLGCEDPMAINIAALTLTGLIVALSIVAYAANLVGYIG